MVVTDHERKQWQGGTPEQWRLIIGDNAGASLTAIWVGEINPNYTESARAVIRTAWRKRECGWRGY